MHPAIRRQRTAVTDPEGFCTVSPTSRRRFDVAARRMTTLRMDP